MLKLGILLNACDESSDIHVLACSENLVGPPGAANREFEQTTATTKRTQPTKGLMSRTMAVHVRCKHFNIS